MIPDHGPDDDFEFKHDGELYRLPPFRKVKAGVVRKVRKLEGLDAGYTLLELVCDERTLAAIDDMEMSEMDEVLTGWQQQSGIGLGESSGSSS